MRIMCYFWVHSYQHKSAQNSFNVYDESAKYLQESRQYFNRIK